jgi:serine/threonine protein kinase
MRNVIRGIGSGEVDAPPHLYDPSYGVLGSVSYIIFEVADGDLRRAVADAGGLLDYAWALRVLHGTANGLSQLHQEKIEHQDLKPSNVMTIERQAKVGDLGNASPPGGGGIFDSQDIAGDPIYAPPELLYGEVHSDERVRRRACDAFHLGSLAVFLISGSGLTGLLSAELNQAFHWRTWPRDYRNALPYVRDAYDCVMTDLTEDPDFAGDAALMDVLAELTDPDPLVRGNPKVPAGAQRYAMQRYVSAFDRLARQAEMDLKSVTG